MTGAQTEALANPLVGREDDAPLHWDEWPWRYGLSFNR
jgi:hypothetical protein